MLWAPHVMFVATHASDEVCSKDSEGNFVMDGWMELVKEIKINFDLDLIVDPSLHVLNAQYASSIGMTDLKTDIYDLKEFLTNYLGKTMGLVEPLVDELRRWTKMLQFPVVHWTSFVGYIRGKMNPLVLESHAKELVNHLQIMGEVVYLISPLADQEDLIVLDPKWLTTEFLGKILSYETIQSSPVHGCFTTEQLVSMFPKVDFPDLRNLFQCMELCVEMVFSDGGTMYYFPALDFIRLPPDVWECWCSKPDEVWHGMQIGSTYQDNSASNQISIMYPKTVVALRNALNAVGSCPVEINEVKQWSTGLRIDADDFCVLILLSEPQQHIDIIARGCRGKEKFMFELSEYCFCAMMLKLQQACPGICLQKRIISPHDLSKAPGVGIRPLRVYESHEIVEAQITNCSPGSSDRDVGVKKDERNSKTSLDVGVESMIDLLALGSEEVFLSLTLGKDAHISCLSIHCRYALAQLLDITPSYLCTIESKDGQDIPEDYNKRGWEALANMLQISDSILKQNEDVNVSKGDAVLAMWSYNVDATIAKLAEAFEQMRRSDCRDILLRFSPVYLCIKNNEPV